MKKVVGIREAKAHFSEYVALARGGAEVIVTDRGRPIVRLVALASSKEAKTEDDVLDELEAAGLIERGKSGPLPARRLAKLAHADDVTALVREHRQ
jgi:prevent-host-death family protein